MTWADLLLLMLLLKLLQILFLDELLLLLLLLPPPWFLPNPICLLDRSPTEVLLVAMRITRAAKIAVGFFMVAMRPNTEKPNLVLAKYIVSKSLEIVEFNCS